MVAAQLRTMMSPLSTRPPRSSPPVWSLFSSSFLFQYFTPHLFQALIFGNFWVNVVEICKRYLYTVSFFSCTSSSIPTYRWRTDWLMNHHSEPSTRPCARVWLNNLQLPYTSKLEVIRDQTTSSFLVYNLKLPYKFDTHQFIMVEMVIIFKMVIMVEMVKMVEMVIMAVMAMVVRLSMLIITRTRDRQDRQVRDER